MSIQVAPVRFQGKPIVFRPTDEGDIVGMADGLAIGRIMRVQRQPSHYIWFWALTNPCLKGLVAPASGQCATIPDAMAEFDTAFDLWLKWALAQPEQVDWQLRRDSAH